MEGELHKQGGFFKLWKKRWFVLKGQNLTYYTKRDGELKGSVELHGCIVTQLNQGEAPKPHSLRITTKTKPFILFANDAAELSRWIGALRNATSAASSQPANIGPQEPAEPLPATIAIEGTPEAGTELRVRTTGCDLDMLCCAWFRLPSTSAIPSPTSDITVTPGFAYLPSAVMQCYTPGEADVTGRIGCLVRRATGSDHRWAVCSGIIQPADLSIPSIRVRLLPHVHHKYCDRRVRVCTATGKYREGEVMVVDVRGTGGKGEQYDVWWYRSCKTVQMIDADRSDPSLVGLTFRVIPIRTRECMPPAPPDHAPAPSWQQVKAAMVESSTALSRPPAPSQEAALFREDVGYMVLAALVPKGSTPPDTLVSPGACAGQVADGVLLSPPVGPVEPAPPRAREIWISGEARVGSLLLGSVYYYGGSPGPCEVTWTAIGDDGEAKVVKGPSAALPAEDMSTESATAQEDAWQFLLPSSLENHIVKLRVKPVRSDGNEGHTESSRPTNDVLPAT